MPIVAACEHFWKIETGRYTVESTFWKIYNCSRVDTMQMAIHIQKLQLGKQ